MGNIWETMVIYGKYRMYDRYPLVICYKLLLKMAIEIVDLPITNGDFQ